MASCYLTESWNDKKGATVSPGYRSGHERCNTTQDSSQRANSWLLTFCEAHPAHLGEKKAASASLHFQYLFEVYYSY